MNFKLHLNSNQIGLQNINAYQYKTVLKINKTNCKLSTFITTNQRALKTYDRNLYVFLCIKMYYLIKFQSGPNHLTKTKCLILKI